MAQRGRKSAGSNLVTFPAIEHKPPLVPPTSLSKAERLQFIELAANAGHLKPVDTPLLAALAQTIMLTRKLAHDPAKAAEWDRALRSQLALTRSLRLSPQSRIDSRAAGRRDQPQGPTPWDD